MATLALAAVGSAVGSSLLPAGIGVLGATISGATIGSQLGAFAGSYVDQALFGGSGQNKSVSGPRLSDLQVTSSTEGAPIPRLYGRARLGGQLIWATDFDEVATTTRQSAGSGKGGGLGGGGQRVTEFSYYANFAVALCEGEISRLGRVWADGREIDMSRFAWRLYDGSEDQLPDSLIIARDGADQAPAYRGVAYIVFEGMALAEFGNRIPQLSFEVFRPVADAETDGLSAVALIPGSGEFVYATEPVRQEFYGGVSRAENVHSLLGPTDWSVAVDQLQSDLPRVGAVSLIVSWFGTDLRAGVCEIKPGVESRDKDTKPLLWSVAGRSRGNAYLVSQRDGRAAYGGTPSDQTVVSAIRDLNDRGLGVTLTPFILMDVAEDNSQPSPYGGASQPPYPWRGRVTCHPAAGQVGSVDKTAAAATQIEAFVGTASISDFAIINDDVVYNGPSEWSFRRMVLHYAFLAKAAGGVEAFQIGSELRGLTQVRASASSYPFVAALVALADDVKSILGPGTKVLYGADWSEYFGHQPSDGSGDVYFHLDPLWASPAIDCIGLDVYWPLADWRDGQSHLDAVAGYTSIYDGEYLKSNVRGGEGFDWYYASESDRLSQARTPITDGAGKPWVFRYKDIQSWWGQPHFNRPGGVESATPTAWVPQSKPFWFTEFGCPAVDKGANQPNVFVDEKSSENALPYYSNGTRDDLMQLRYVKAFREAFDPTSDGYVAGANPVSTVTGQRMVDVSHMIAYCWDARPYPAFPSDIETWSDATNWSRGHWLNGRMSGADLALLVAKLMRDFGFEDFDSSALVGIVPGYVIDRVMAARDALQPLELGYFFDSVESGGAIMYRPRGAHAWPTSVTPVDMVETGVGSDLLSLTRGQETELPASAKVRFISADDDYRQAVAEARRLTGASGRVAQADLPILLDFSSAGPLAETWLFETWAARERASFEMPPSALALEPGDVVTLNADGQHHSFRVTEISDHGGRAVNARGIDLNAYIRTPLPDRRAAAADQIAIGPPDITFLDLPDWTGTDSSASGTIAVVQEPWPGAIAIYASPQTVGYQYKGLAGSSSTVGTTLDPIGRGVEGRLDYASRFRVELNRGRLSSTDLLTMLAGENYAALRHDDGQWEIIQYANAELVGTNTYELSGVLRGQFGSDGAMAALPAGATFVVLDGAVANVPLTDNEFGLPFQWRIGQASRDIGHDSYTTSTFTFHGLYRRPFSPVHIKGTRVSDDLSITWIRRTRLAGDQWDIAAVPLGEDLESYVVEILDGDTVRRTLTTSAPHAIYSQAEQIEDFGAVQASVDVRVAQISATFGPGTARHATL